MLFRPARAAVVSLWPAVLAFAVGTLVLQWLPALPAWSGLGSVVAAVFVLVLVLVSASTALLPARFRRLGSWARWLGWLSAALLAGFLWAWLHAAWLMSAQLPAELEGQDVWVEGTIVSLPDSGDHQSRRRTRFEMMLDRADGWADGRADGRTDDWTGGWLGPGRVRISWYRDAPALQPGQRWRLLLRLKQRRGFANPGGFDYAGWLFRKHIVATGYVRRSERNQLLGTALLTGRLDRWRQQLAAVVQRQPADAGTKALLRALVVGDRSGIEQSQWQTLSATGTSHLLAISGLHIGLVALFGFFAGRWLWSLPAVTVQWWPAPMAGALTGLLAAAGYALLAGWTLPTQRALVMVAVVMAGVLLRRSVAPSRSLALALAAVLLIDPLAMLSAGFWLSFGAVGLLLFGMGWRPRQRGWWWRWGRAQWLVAVGLFPLLALLFQQVSLVSPLANLVAIPWVSFSVVPPLLVGTLVSPWWPWAGDGLLALAAGSLQWLWQWLDWLAGIEPSWFALSEAGSTGAALVSWQLPALPLWVVLVALAGVLLLLAPAGLPGRWLGLLGLLPVLLYAAPRPQPGAAWLTLLDVGHGLAVVVQTHGHTLLFDTGPRYGPGFDAGGTVILPYLRAQGIRHLDTVIVSHADADHVGGLASLRRGMPVQRLLSGVAERFDGAQACHAGQRWRWDGVLFELLHPAADGRWHGNDGSCVLRVSAGGGSALVPGDIEAGAENALVANYSGQSERLAADVLVAAHHGSRTSSTAAFIAAVAADTVLFPVGYRDRYGHPHTEVVERFVSHAAQLADTASLGAIRLRLGRETLTGPCAWRGSQRRYWRRPPPDRVGIRAWSDCLDDAE